LKFKLFGCDIFWNFEIITILKLLIMLFPNHGIYKILIKIRRKRWRRKRMDDTLPAANGWRGVEKKIN